MRMRQPCIAFHIASFSPFFFFFFFFKTSSKERGTKIKTSSCNLEVFSPCDRLLNKIPRDTFAPMCSYTIPYNKTAVLTRVCVYVNAFHMVFHPNWERSLRYSHISPLHLQQCPKRPSTISWQFECAQEAPPSLWIDFVFILWCQHGAESDWLCSIMTSSHPWCD